MSTNAESGQETGATPTSSDEPEPVHPSPEAAINASTSLRAGNGCSIDPNGAPKP